jgi:hypothetical protein
MPAHKKHPSTRARRNKAATAATLIRSTQANTAAEDYESLTVAQLKVELGRRNTGRADDDQLSLRGRKADLVSQLLDDDSPIPSLPPAPMTASGEPGWHHLTIKWWHDVWSSPMSAEWDGSDLHNLYILAALENDFWTAINAAGRKDAEAAIRMHRKDLGLTPYDRRRLEWTIESADEAKDRGAKRRATKAGTGNDQPKPNRPDPRAGLHAVS